MPHIRPAILALALLLVLAASLTEPASPTHAEAFPVKFEMSRPGSPSRLSLSRPPVVQARLPQQAPATLDWRACGGQWQCATLRVPLDHANPADRTIEVAVTRRPALDPARRIGSLVVNPGGPGASGIALARGLAFGLPLEVQQRFDLVGFDPRGVGQSTALVCHDTIQAMGALDPEPRTAAGWAETVATTRTFVAGCTQAAGDLLPHLGSLAVVRDMESLRQALGDQRLTYLGYSYGTLLGALYADRFPDRVRALVLDGAVEVGMEGPEALATQALGFARAFEQFAADCRRRACPLTSDAAGNPADPAAEVLRLIEAARARPFPSATADRPAGPGETMLAILQSLYTRSGWRTLENAAVAARQGDGSVLVRLADQYLGKRGGAYDNSYEMNAAVNCLDYRWPRDIEAYQQLADALEARIPHLGRSFAPGALLCALWPPEPQPVALTGGRPQAPVLIVGTTGDPATPFRWALALRRELPNSVLLTNEGEGHTIYAQGNACIDTLVSAYLISGATPEDGAVCAADATEPRPPPTPPAQAAVPTPILEAPPQPIAVAPTATPEESASRESWGVSVAPRNVSVLVALILVISVAWALRRRGNRRKV